jgi:hypothetical protein
LTFPKLKTTSLTTTSAKVLASIKEKDFLLYPTLMKSGSNTRNPNKFCLFHHDHEHDIKKYHALVKELERLISKRYLQEFIKEDII